MGTINQGDQTIFPDYGLDVDSPEFMRSRSDIVPVGIYRNLEAVKQGSDVAIAPGVMEIRDENDRQVRIETDSPVVVTPTQSEPWIVAQWDFNDRKDWYADFLTVNMFNSHDIILGKAVYSGANFVSLDLSDRTYPTWAELDSDGDKVNEIRLVPNGNV